MKKFILGAFIALMATTAVAENGGKGGGIERIDVDGVSYVTFDRYQLRLRHADRSEIPAIEMLIGSIMKMILPDYYQGELLRSIIPGTDRSYYYIDNITPQQEAQLKEIYRKTVKANHPIEIAAVTSGTDTYLLPKFKAEASDFHRAKTLFHEALWVFSYNHSKGITYDAVVETEVAYGEYLRSQNQTQIADVFPMNFYMRLEQALQEPSLLLGAALLYDKQHNNYEAFRDWPLLVKFLGGDTGYIYGYAFVDKEDLVVATLKEIQVHPDVIAFQVLSEDQNACFVRRYDVPELGTAFEDSGDGHFKRCINIYHK